MLVVVFEVEVRGAEREVGAELWFSQMGRRLVCKPEGGLVQMIEEQEGSFLVSH